MRVHCSILTKLIALVVIAVATSIAPSALAADDRLNFTATTLGGAPFNGASLQGKPAVLWFWTPWCPYCNAEAPGSARLRPPTPGDFRGRGGALGCRGDAELRLQIQPELHQPQ